METNLVANIEFIFHLQNLYLVKLAKTFVIFVETIDILNVFADYTFCNLHCHDAWLFLSENRFRFTQMF